ncbi:MAG: hypothetical protein IID33_02225 [Planctomycetes bacterium]|nr:hypothetical protein [Planctomycetota bacterium]
MNRTTTSTNTGRYASTARRRQPAVSRASIILLVLAALACLLPPAWAGCARAVTYPLTWLQSALGGGSRAVHAAVQHTRDERPSHSDFDTLELHDRELQRQVQHQSVEIADLKQQIEQLTGLRSAMGDQRTRLVPAAVLAYDPSSRHETLRLDVGTANTSEHGRIRVGQWVVAGVAIRAGQPSETGRVLLSRQWLLGKISEVGAFSSRLMLATDPRFGPIRVRAAKRLADGTLIRAVDPRTQNPRSCLLEGLGQGRMVIRQAPANYLDAEYDRVLVPAGADLPVAMLIGRMIAAQSVEDAPLVFDLTIEPPADLSKIGTVFVIVTGS